jgi:hypothetical protein
MNMEQQGVQRIRRRKGGQATSMSNMMNNYADMMDEWNQSLYRPTVEIVQNMIGNWMDLVQSSSRIMYPNLQTRRTRKDCQYQDNCDCDNCFCHICDADIVIYGRVTEQRVIPLVIENSRHRAREISIELSDFVKSDDKNVKLHSVVQPAEFELATCSEQEVILGIHMLPTNIEEGKVIGSVDAIREKGGISTNIPGRTNIPDVESCTVFYADLSVKGCEMRPMRIAAVLLPRDCDPIQIECSCGCC